MRLVTLRTRRPRDLRRERGIEGEGGAEEEQARHVARLPRRHPPGQGERDRASGDEGQHRPLQGQEREGHGRCRRE